MCGRLALAAPKAELVTHFRLDEFEGDGDDFPARYNIPPGTDIAVIRQSPEGKRVLHRLRWGLIPHWAKDPSIGTKLNNARGESVDEKPSFKSAFSRRRCLIPASGFYEWKNEGKAKQPYYFSLKSGAPWPWPDSGSRGKHRMPVIVGEVDWQDWLGAPAENVKPVIRPYDANDLQAWPVDRRVSRTGEDDEGLIAPLSSMPEAPV